MCPALVAEISLPPTGNIVLDPEVVAPELHRFDNNVTECMMLDDRDQWKTV